MTSPGPKRSRRAHKKKAPNVLLFRCNPRKGATTSTDLHNLKEPFETVRAQHFEYNLFQILNYLIGSNSFQYKQCRLTLPSALHILMFPLTSAIFSVCLLRWSVAVWATPSPRLPLPGFKPSICAPARPNRLKHCLRYRLVYHLSFNNI